MIVNKNYCLIKKQCWLLDNRSYVLDKPGGNVAIDYAVVEGGTNCCYLADHDLVVYNPRLRSD
jgi:hypothetical protein